MITERKIEPGFVAEMVSMFAADLTNVQEVSAFEMEMENEHERDFDAEKENPDGFVHRRLTGWRSVRLTLRYKEGEERRNREASEV